MSARSKMAVGWLLPWVLIGGGCGREGSPLAPEEIPLAARRAGTLKGTSSESQPQQVPDDFPFKKILCFGDSITLGVTLRSPLSLLQGAHSELALVEGYVPKLWRLLEAEYGTGLELVNAGIGGETTREGLERIDYEIRLHEPDLILLLEGVVDINNEFPRFPVVRSNLAEMMRIGQLRGKFVIIGTYPLLNPDGFRASGAGNIPRLNDVIRQEAKAKNVPIADHEKASGKDFRGQGPDGLHPNNIGYEIMAESWFDTIGQVLAEMGGT